MTDLAVRGQLDLLKETPKAYRYTARRFLGFLEDNRYGIGDPKGWKAYQDHLAEAEKSGYIQEYRRTLLTVAGSISVVRSICLSLRTVGKLTKIDATLRSMSVL